MSKRKSDCLDDTNNDANDTTKVIDEDQKISHKKKKIKTNFSIKITTNNSFIFTKIEQHIFNQYIEQNKKNKSLLLFEELDLKSVSYNDSTKTNDISYNLPLDKEIVIKYKKYNISCIIVAITDYYIAETKIVAIHEMTLTAANKNIIENFINDIFDSHKTICDYHFNKKSNKWAQSMTSFKISND